MKERHTLAGNKALIAKERKARSGHKLSVAGGGALLTRGPDWPSGKGGRQLARTGCGPEVRWMIVSAWVHSSGVFSLSDGAHLRERIVSLTVVPSHVRLCLSDIPSERV